MDALPLLGSPTGVGAFCLGALRSLSQQEELRVTAFAVTRGRSADVRERLPSGVALAQGPMPARPLHALWSRCPLPPLELFVGNVDVVHGTNSQVPPTFRAAPVVTVHDLTPVRFPELTNRLSPDYRALIHLALRRGAWVHTDSEFVAREVIDTFGVPAYRVRGVAPGIPPLPALTQEVARSVVEQELGQEPPRYLLAVGTAEPRKDLPGLVRAFDDVARQDPDLRLVLVGAPGWGEHALTESIDAAQYRDRIVRTGWVGDVTLSAFLTRAAVLVYPSIYEGFGFPPLQAMAAGVPVVASSAGSLPEVLGGAAWLFEQGDHDKLVAALLRTLRDDVVRERLVRKGHARADMFNWSQFGLGMSKLYRDLHEEHRG